jgi:hypothetical protein
MKVDKQNQNVCYNDEKHTYWDENGVYVSVTTLIGKFCQDFDSEFWSAYKALERLLTPEEFKMEKSQLLKTHKIDLPYILDMYDITENQFNKAQQDILDEWAKTNAQSCERGSKIHAELEGKYTSKKYCDAKKFGLGGKFEVNTNASLTESNRELLDIDKGIFPEYMIYRKSNDGKFRLAGQIDLLIKDGNDIYIVDYKTNKKLDDKSYFDTRTKKCQMMKYPMNNLMDCNKVHYALQLSTYAWMLQKLNPEFVIKKLMLIHYDHEGRVSEHELDYLKDDVERMCKFYKKQSRLEALKESRRPVKF